MLSSTFILSDWAANLDNKEKIGFVEVPESEKKGGWYDYNKMYENNAGNYYGEESNISLCLQMLHYIPAFNVDADKIVDYYLLMRNAVPSSVHAVCYF